MRILVTGGAGFIGSHLCDYLLKKKHTVICMDNLITGNRENIAHLNDQAKFKFIKQDVTKYIDLPGKLDAVFHFASPASPIDYIKLPIQTLKVGSLGTHNSLGLAKVKKARFILASSSEVYGDPREHPQKEEYYGNVNCIGPRGVYDEAKRFAEAITMAYHNYHRVDTKIARIFNTYGPRMRNDDGRAIPAFLTQALNNKPVTVFGKGTQTRSFCYIDDMIDGIYRLLLSNINEPVNLGNPAEFTVLELAKMIVKMTGSQSKIIFKPLPVDDPKVRQPDITKARKKLKWGAKIQLKEGLEKTVPYFR
jgi:dTDP-glucose 4,6-dehydratase